MNTANPQLEGLYLALSALCDLLVEKGVVEREELHDALQKAERSAVAGSHVDGDTDSRRKAIAFPIHFLLLASKCTARGEVPSFHELTREIGRGG
ncbi:MAG TPA: hypothetical protein VK181_15630 [Rhizobium sp.]|nr:hypothetical protein [Rhizobium sp.]